jgi:hypothetical protein
MTGRHEHCLLVADATRRFRFVEGDTRDPSSRRRRYGRVRLHQQNAGIRSIDERTKPTKSLEAQMIRSKSISVILAVLPLAGRLAAHALGALNPREAFGDKQSAERISSVRRDNWIGTLVSPGSIWPAAGAHASVRAATDKPAVTSARFIPARKRPPGRAIGGVWNMIDNEILAEAQCPGPQLPWFDGLWLPPRRPSIGCEPVHPDKLRPFALGMDGSSSETALN